MGAVSPNGIVGFVTDAPNLVQACAGGTWTWNKVRFDNGIEGYVASEALVKIGVAVVNPLDRGKTLDSDAAGTLSYALQTTVSGQLILFYLQDNGRLVDIRGELPFVAPGVTLRGVGCSDKVRLTGQNVGNGTPGLRLSGNNRLENLQIANFSGVQLLATRGANKLACVSVLGR